jgi:diketogulonate reductase-like aldo/keto reductase
MGAIVDMFNEANLKFLAATQSVTIAQIVLNYLVYELGVSVIPKTSKADRLKENISIHDFRLNHK